jgi:hypothetical protein
MNNVKFPMNLQLFAEADPNPEPTPNPEPKADPQPPKTFTQEELDQIVQDRIARERKKAEKFADYDEIKAKLDALDAEKEERKKAEMTETERLKAEKEEAERLAAEAKAERDKAMLTAAKSLIKSEFRSLAREMNVRADAIDDAYRLADTSQVTVDDDGNVIGLADVVKALVETKPYLVEKAAAQPKPIGSPSGGSGGSGGNPGDDERKTLEQQLIEAKKAKNLSKVIEISNKLRK